MIEKVNSNTRCFDRLYSTKIKEKTKIGHTFKHNVYEAIFDLEKCPFKPKVNQPSKKPKNVFKSSERLYNDGQKWIKNREKRKKVEVSKMFKPKIITYKNKGHHVKPSKGERLGIDLGSRKTKYYDEEIFSPYRFKRGYVRGDFDEFFDCGNDGFKPGNKDIHQLCEKSLIKPYMVKTEFSTNVPIFELNDIQNDDVCTSSQLNGEIKNIQDQIEELQNIKFKEEKKEITSKSENDHSLSHISKKKYESKLRTSKSPFTSKKSHDKGISNFLAKKDRKNKKQRNFQKMKAKKKEKKMGEKSKHEKSIKWIHNLQKNGEERFFFEIIKRSCEPDNKLTDL